MMLNFFENLRVHSSLLTDVPDDKCPSDIPSLSIRFLNFGSVSMYVYFRSTESALCCLARFLM